MTGSLKVAWQRLQNLSGSIISLFWCKAKVEATRKGFVRRFDRAAVRESKQKQWKDPEGAKLSSMLNGKKGWVTSHTCRCSTACVNYTVKAFSNWENWQDLGELKDQLLWSAAFATLGTWILISSYSEEARTSASKLSNYDSLAMYVFVVLLSLRIP